MAAKIKALVAREILDSRGNPTVEATVILSDGTKASTAVPSGASTGKYEALELRDNDPKRFVGLGVLKAVANVNDKCAPLLKSLAAEKQNLIDQLLIDLDATVNKRRLGANAMLAVSQVVLKAAALSYHLPLYRYIKKKYGLGGKFFMPTPTFNLINAGKHGPSPIEFQEFHIIPEKPKSFSQKLMAGQKIYSNTKQELKARGLDTALGDEGGFSPKLLTNLDGLEVLRVAVKQSGYALGKDIFLGLDTAANYFLKQGQYRLKDFSKPLDSLKLSQFYQKIRQRFHLKYLEDPFAEDDWDSWIQLKKDLPPQVLLVADDLTCTNPERLRRAVSQKACNAILIKPNQIGTMSETISVIKIAQAAKLAVVVSHRSGETNDDFIADTAVGVGADMVKFGAPARGERIAKYNRLLAIASELAASA